MDKSPDSPTVVEHEEGKMYDSEADAEQVGTIILSSNDVGRQALRPQPSNDPNDPLNWPAWQKYSTLLTICFFTFLATANASKLTVSVTTLAKEFKVDSTVAGYQVCFNVLLLGCGNIFWVPLMRVIGKRPVFLMALPLLVASNVWSMKTNNWNSLLAASIVSGFASSAGEGPVPALVADLFFVHQRGTAMMIFHMALSCGFFLGPLINAYVVQFSSFRVSFEWIAIAAGVTWVVAIFTVNETAYYNRDVKAPESAYGPKNTFVQRMGVTIGYNKDQNIFTAFVNTLAVASYPGVFWSGITVGTFVGWNIVVQLTASRTLLAPPYHHKTGFLGLISISGFIGSALALFFGGKLIDVISNRVTASRGGRREPEYRLYAIIIPAIIGPMGILLFGLEIAERKPWVGIAFGYGMQGFGLTAISNVVVTYAVDSYLPLAGEALVVVFVLRGITGTVLALYSFNWIGASGEKNAFGQMVGIQYFVCLFAIVFLVWGKKIRAKTARFGPMAWGNHKH